MNQRRGFFKSALAGLVGIAIMPFVAGKKAALPTIDMGKAPLGRGFRMDWRAAEAYLGRANGETTTGTYTTNGDTISIDLRDIGPMDKGIGCFGTQPIRKDSTI